MKKNLLIFIFSFLFFTHFLEAQPMSGPMGTVPEGMPPMAQMPQFQGMSTGVFNGTLLTMDQGKKTPLADQTVVILVFQNGQRMLMLNKKTDREGHFQFKNIFIDPSFTYEIGTMWKENLYVMPKLQLQPKEKEKKIEFTIGEGSPYFVSSIADAQAQEESPQEESSNSKMMPNNSRTAESKSITLASYWEYTYQKIAIVLCGIILLFAGYHFLQPRRSA